ncbi:hypothetical protein SAMN04488066_11928 [Halorubrum aquaticum]|uniref:Uncharacterized protein n=1 Tax=Halorubrum aquaticum TaxID=387340 RepID=A0A1I3C5L7_9EURY|nr:hypothetical protein [Halorubrum aquaticum]SFH69834.1 hypothetical protein SAMN04488066_11928 [Halorubrum aquaticum]
MAGDGIRTDGSGSRSSGRKRAFRLVAVQAATVSAATHLLWAWPRLVEPAASADPRPYVFVLAAAFTAVVAAATLRADEYRRLYALGAGTLAAYLVGYVAWHGGGTAAALSADPLAIVGKTAEVVGVAAFLALYRLAPPTSVVVARRAGDESEGSKPDGGESEDG